MFTFAYGCNLFSDLLDRGVSKLSGSISDSTYVRVTGRTVFRCHYSALLFQQEISWRENVNEWDELTDLAFESHTVFMYHEILLLMVFNHVQYKKIILSRKAAQKRTLQIRAD